MKYGLETFDKNGVSNNTGFFVTSVRFIYLDHSIKNATYPFEPKEGMQLKFLYIRTNNIPTSATVQFRRIYSKDNSIIVEPSPNRPTDAYGSLRTGGYIMVYYGE